MFYLEDLSDVFVYVYRIYGVPTLGKVAAAVVLLLVVAVLGYYLYTEYQRIQALNSLKVYLADVRVASVGLTSATLELKLRLYNPAGVSVTIDRVVYTLYGEGATSTPSAEKRPPAAWGSKTVRVVVEA